MPLPALLAAAGPALMKSAPYLLSFAGGLFGGSKKKTQDGSGGGYEVVTMPQYSFTEPRLRLMSDFVSDNLTRIGQGKRPAYYDNAVPYIREGLERPLYQRYFGRAGDRTGVVNAAMEAGAAMGLGPAATAGQVNKALARYEDAGKQIDEFIEKTGVDVTQEALRTSLYAGLSMPKGPDAQIVNYGGYGPQTSGGGMTDALSSIAGNIPYLSDLLRVFQGGQADTSGAGGTGLPTPTPRYDIYNNPAYRAPNDYYMNEKSMIMPDMSKRPNMLSNILNSGVAPSIINLIGQFMNRRGGGGNMPWMNQPSFPMGILA